MSEAQVAMPGLAQQDTKAQLTAKLSSGGSWFFWIAALSVVNTVISMFQGNTTFILGLAYTQLVDYMGGGGLIGVVVSLAIAGIFVVFGMQSIKKHKWAFIAGMALYLVDGLIFAMAQDWLPVAIHAYALFCLWGGYQALTALLKIEQPRFA